MTTASLHEFRENQPDKLILNAIVTLTTEQEDFITQHISDSRPVLFKKFKLRFNSPINKFQFNFVVEKVKENIVKAPKKNIRKVPEKYAMPKVEREKNVVWSSEQGLWIVKFKKNHKTTIVGKFFDHELARKAAQEYRLKLA